MAAVTVEDDGLRGLARVARAVADEARRAEHLLPRGGAPLGYVAETHATVLERWNAGLGVAEAAAHELAEKVDACRVAYAAADDDASVTFTGLDR